MLPFREMDSTMDVFSEFNEIGKKATFQNIRRIGLEWNDLGLVIYCVIITTLEMIIMKYFIDSSDCSGGLAIICWCSK